MFLSLKYICLDMIRIFLFFCLLLSACFLTQAEKEERDLDVLVFEPSKERTKFTLMIVCGIHAREAGFTRGICQSVADDLSRSIPINYRVKVVMVPLANPEGLAILQSSPNMSCWRCNKNQVDLNRNFPLVYSNMTLGKQPPAPFSAGPGDQEYPGPFPFSEWETRSLDRLMKKHKPNMLISVHTGTLALFPPYDFTSVKPKGYGKMVQVANWMRDGVCDECFVGRSTNYLGYRAYGTLTDYAYYFLGIPYVYTLEAFDAPEMHARGQTEEDGMNAALCERIFATGKTKKEMERWLPLFERVYSASVVIIEQL